MRHRLTYLILLLIGQLLTLPAKAADGQLFTSDKLSSGLITCIHQDRYGFIWVGTEYGLNKFDGYRYTAYYHSRRDSTTLTDNEVASLFTDSKGRLWIGCSRGLVSYDYANDRFRRYVFPDHLMPRITCLAESSDGRLFIGTAGYGLYTLSDDGHIDYASAFNRRTADHFYSRMHIDREGYLWRSSHQNTMTRFQMKDGQMKALTDFTSTAGMPMTFLEREDGLLLIVCMNGLLTYRYATGELTPSDIALSTIDRPVTIEDATLDGQGNLYLATSNSGLVVVPATGGAAEHVDGGDSRIALTNTHVVDVMEDKNHNIWAACYNKGLLKLTNRQTPFRTWSFSHQQYVMGGGLSSMTQDADGQLWCTVQNDGVYLFGNDGRIAAHPQSPTGTRLIFRSSKGQYWLTAENTLYRYQPLTGTATAAVTLRGRGLNCMAEDAHGRLYVSAFGAGLYVYDPANGQGRLLSMQDTSRKGGHLCNDWIKALMPDSHGMLWIATTSGVSALDTETLAFDRLGWDLQLSEQQCYSLCETAAGDILIGTEHGLYVYSRQQNSVREADHCEVLHDKMLCAMVSDSKGMVWLSTSKGIWRYDPVKGRLTGPVAGNGQTSQAYMQGVSAHGADDRISFGTADGVVSFLPGNISDTRQHPGRALLTRFTANGHALDPTQTTFTLPYQDNTFTVEYSLLDFRDVENIAFQYRLKGSRQWMQTDTGNNQLTFIHMAPGSYTLEVRTVCGDAVSEQVSTLHICILQPWYKTWWFQLLVLLAVLGFLALSVFSWRSYQQEKRLYLTINALKENGQWLRSKFFGHLEQKGDIEPVRVKGNDDKLMERIVKCVNENISNTDFSVEMLTQQVGISRAQLHRKMKEMTGLSTSEFIRNMRLEQATRLIRERKINITQIAYAVGFNNQAHFSTVFKKHYGMTPTEYQDSPQMRQNETTMKHAKSSFLT